MCIVRGENPCQNNPFILEQQMDGNGIETSDNMLLKYIEYYQTNQSFQNVSNQVGPPLPRWYHQCVEWISHLEATNGWWRKYHEAVKLII